MRIVNAALVAGWLGILGWPLAAQNPPAQEPPVVRQTQQEADAKSAGCLACHAPDVSSMHVTSTVRLGCTDCHGGDATPRLAAGASRGAPLFDEAKRAAHVEPTLPIWRSSANPVRAYSETLREGRAFIRFVNPGDLRVAGESCGPCHAREVKAVRKSMMTHGGMLWGAALYNNGAFPLKNPQFGELYTPDGTPATAFTVPPPTAEDTRVRGILPFLQPLFRWEVTQPGNILRVLEQGGGRPLEIGAPDVDEAPGRPRNRLSARGLGTLTRTDPVFLGLQKTRLFDPLLSQFGTNDQAGDYRSSGCTACHVLYANDSSPVHAATARVDGAAGTTATKDPMIPRDEPGHPIAHVLTRSIPTSQCFVCHMHPGTNVVTAYAGLMWWDNETDGSHLYPTTPVKLAAAHRVEIESRNPEGSATRGLWGDPAFLSRTGSDAFNRGLERVTFADFHGHGWVFRAVFKRDRKGTLLDELDQPLPNVSSEQLIAAMKYQDVAVRGPGGRAPARPGVPVHLKDIHLERGMHCVDCHFSQDSHGDGKLYGETRNAVEIQCSDCHGSVRARATLRTSGWAAPEGGTDLSTLSTPFGDARFESLRGQITQRSMVTKGLEWIVPQVLDSVTPGHARFNERAAYAKTVRKDGTSSGDASAGDQLAHMDARMTCQSCHSSWMTSCFGCHLSQRTNEKRPMLHNEGTESRNWTSYNFQVLRDDVFMLGVDGTATGNRISPVRSSSAVLVSSEDANRQIAYLQQQTVSAEGYAGHAFNTHVPHTVRTRETKRCTDCHVSARGDNNAWLAQLFLQGTNFVNFIGRFVYVATGAGGIEAVEVTEVEEPQAVIGSDLHRLAYPDRFASHEQRGRRLTRAERHGSSNALALQARGEYLYVADDGSGLRVFDVAQVHQKGFSQKITSAPVSPIGQRTFVRTRAAADVAAPSTLAVDPARQRLAVNEERPIHPLYAYLYVADREEGLVVATAATLLDGNPANNFLERAATFNPGGALAGARKVVIAGRHAYVLCDAGLAVVDIDNPLQPALAARVSEVRDGRALAVQFRYAFVVDADGLKVIDVTWPERPRLVSGASVPFADARGLYVARTYAYVAAGRQGLAIVDIERPEQPRLDQVFDAGGAMDDVFDVKVGMTNASLFAYVADGKNGLRVIQLVSANGTPGAFGFSPRSTPSLIATHRTRRPALAISKGLDRDRAVDESGNQIAVFGRRGARPFTFEEMRRLFIRDGKLWTVDEAPPRRE